MGVEEWEGLVESHAWYQGAKDSKSGTGTKFIDGLADK